MKKELNEVERAGLKVLFNQFMSVIYDCKEEIDFFYNSNYFGCLCSTDMANGYPIEIINGYYLSWISIDEGGNLIMALDSVFYDQEVLYEFNSGGNFREYEQK